jgi:hypothetical protein
VPPQLAQRAGNKFRFPLDNPGGQCVAAFRPRIVSSAHIRKYIQFRRDGRRITGIVDLINIRSLSS